MPAFIVPREVRTTIDRNERVVALNTRTGQWHALNESGSMVFRELKRSGDLEMAISTVGSEFPSIPGSEIRADVDRLVSSLLRRGLLIPSAEHVRHAGGSPVALAPRPDGDVTVVRQALAAVCVIAAIVALRLPFRTVIRMVALLKRALARRAASDSDARMAVTTVERVGRHVPARVACMEISLASVLLCTLYGRALDWCFGCSADPIAFHSWVEVNGEPVRAPGDEPITSVYRRVLTV